METRKLIKERCLKLCLQCPFHMQYARTNANNIFVCIHQDILDEEPCNDSVCVTKGFPKIIDWQKSQIQMNHVAIPEWCPLPICEHEEEETGKDECPVCGDDTQAPPDDNGDNGGGD